MKYVDTGSRDPEQALAKWLEGLNTIEVEELRIQSGFYSLGGIGLLLPILERHVRMGKATRILVGSNEGSTLRADVLGLAGYMGIPREGARLGVVAFGNAYFHPKTYHVRREDGSQAAYVGSANLSAAGLALHVEAGITLDTRDGDDAHHLDEIAAAIDAWFDDKRDGLHVIEDIESIDALVSGKILAAAPKPKPKPSGPPADGNTASTGSPKAKLKPVVSLPAVKSEEAAPADEPKEEESEEAVGSEANEDAVAAPAKVPVTGTSISATSAAAAATTSYAPSPAPARPPMPAPTASHTPAAAAVPTAVPKNGFPQYVLFDPAATTETSGAGALTGTPLPSGAVGLIVQLNLDSARHFMGKKGTANISIPVPTVGTIRFGISGVHDRPRAVFPLEFRYVGAAVTLVGAGSNTSIQGYGFAPGESGHADVRMLVPADIRSFGEQIKAAGRKVPTNGDFALLEWPTPTLPVFRLTFLEAGSPLATTVSSAFAAALKAGQVVGQGASWLASGMSPAW